MLLRGKALKMSKEFKYPIPITFNRKLCSGPSGSFKNFILTDCVINPKPMRSLERFPLSLGELDKVFQARRLLLGHQGLPHSSKCFPDYNPLICH